MGAGSVPHTARSAGNLFRMGSPKASWIAELPHSRMVYPDTFLEQIRYWFWRLYTPLHPYLRDLSTKLRIIRHEGRQDFLVGKINTEHSVRDFVSYLVAQGFGNHFVAWKDTDELVSLRRTEGFRYQYHVRIFNDGEVRCHYEYTPEYRPIQHLIQSGFEERTAEFRAILEDWIVPADSKPVVKNDAEVFIQTDFAHP